MDFTLAGGMNNWLLLRLTLWIKAKMCMYFHSRGKNRKRMLICLVDCSGDAVCRVLIRDMVNEQWGGGGEKGQEEQTGAERGGVHWMANGVSESRTAASLGPNHTSSLLECIRTIFSHKCQNILSQAKQHKWVLKAAKALFVFLPSIFTELASWGECNVRAWCWMNMFLFFHAGGHSGFWVVHLSHSFNTNVLLDKLIPFPWSKVKLSMNSCVLFSLYLRNNWSDITSGTSVHKHITIWVHTEMSVNCNCTLNYKAVILVWLLLLWWFRNDHLSSFMGATLVQRNPSGRVKKPSGPLALTQWSMSMGMYICAYSICMVVIPLSELCVLTLLLKVRHEHKKYNSVCFTHWYSTQHSKN